jgi:hypothetical protein
MKLWHITKVQLNDFYETTIADSAAKEHGKIDIVHNHLYGTVLSPELRKGSR